MASQEEKIGRMVALIAAIEGMLNLPGDAALARRIGISISALQRLKRQQQGRLTGENLTGICHFLQIEPEEFNAYLEGKLRLDEITARLPSSLSPEEESYSALRQFEEQIFPKLLLPELYSVLLMVQQRFFATFPTYAKMEAFFNQNSTSSSNLTIPNLFKGKDLKQIAEQVNLDQNRDES